MTEDVTTRDKIANGADRCRELLREAREADSEERKRELCREMDQIALGIKSHAMRLEECDEA